MGDKYKQLKVTVVQTYLIPMVDDEISKINGWTLDEIKEGWFKSPGAHATRDSCHVGNADEVTDIKEMDL
jgi:hypothetical protein